ncbi:MAG TPA: hypothetical protein GXX28_02800 [Firmicutes bacterium]|nr:hypothetical protein [Bacillota bacterium]
MRHRLVAAFLTLSLGCLVSVAAPPASSPAFAAGPPPEGRRAVLLLLDGVGLKDLVEAEMPNFRRLLVQRGAIAAANVRPAGGYSQESGYVGLGAGTRAYGTADAGLVMATGELYDQDPAGVVFTRNTGLPAPPGSLVHLALPRLLAVNATADHPVVVGALGQALREASRRVVLLGQADTPESLNRLAGCVAMDERGIVPEGDVGLGLVKPDSGFPTGQRTDYDRLLAAFRRVYPRAQLIVVETGDTARLNSYSPWILPAQNARMRQRALQWFDAFLGELAKSVDWNRTLVLVAVPGPTAEAAAAGDCLTFMAAFGPEIRPGLLSSPTTRRPGLVTAADVAPTILDWLGVPIPPAMTGRPFGSQPFPGPLPALLLFAQRATATYNERPSVLKGYVILQIAFILAGLVTLFLAPRLPAKAGAVLRAGLAGLTAVPLALLLLPLVQTGILGYDALLVAGLSVLLVFLAWLPVRSLSRAFILLYLATGAVILADVALGAKLGRASLLGYDPIGGARYYGLGNEYMGVLLGAVTLGCSALLDFVPPLRRHWRLAVLAPLGLAALLTGLTSFGANFGGLLGAVATLVAAWLVFRERRPVLRDFLALAGLGVGLTALVVAADALRPNSGASHVGLLLRQITAVGPGALYEVASRKLAMNFRLMRYTPWADGLVTFIAGLGVLFYRPVGLLRKIVLAQPYFTKGFWAALAGTVVVFLVNDSGVVAAATFMLYPTAYLLNLALQTAFTAQ